MPTRALISSNGMFSPHNCLQRLFFWLPTMVKGATPSRKKLLLCSDWLLDISAAGTLGNGGCSDMCLVKSFVPSAKKWTVPAMTNVVLLFFLLWLFNSSRFFWTRIPELCRFVHFWHLHYSLPCPQWLDARVPGRHVHLASFIAYVCLIDFRQLVVTRYSLQWAKKSLCKKVWALLRYLVAAEQVTDYHSETVLRKFLFCDSEFPRETCTRYGCTINCTRNIYSHKHGCC